MTSRPSKGGSYVREKDGSLRLVESTQQANAAPSAAEPPAPQGESGKVRSSSAKNKER